MRNYMKMMFVCFITKRYAIKKRKIGFWVNKKDFASFSYINFYYKFALLGLVRLKLIFYSKTNLIVLQ